MAIFFNGKFVVQPSTNVFVDNSRLANLNPGAANVLALIGPSTAGAPQQPIAISDPATARSVLRSGDLLDAVLLAFAPSTQTGGATTLFAVRVNSAVQSRVKVYDITNPVKASQTFTVAGAPAGGNTITATIAGVAVIYTLSGPDTTTTAAAGLAALINASTNAVISDALSGVSATSTGAVVTVLAKSAGVDSNSITTVAGASGGVTLTAGGATLAGGTGNTLATLTSKDYGLYTNQLNYQFAAGSVSGVKSTLSLTTTGNVIGGSLVQDNIARGLFTIQYTGAGSASTLTVNDSSLTTSCTGAPADNLNIAFATYGSIQQVFDFINATGKYSVTALVASSAALVSLGQFDPKSAVDVKTSGVALTGNLQAVIDFLNNSNNNIFCTAVRQNNPLAGTPAFAAASIYFVGGSDGTTSNSTDWPNAINSLQTSDVDVVVPVTADAVVHASVLQHVTFMSGTGRKPRVAVVGGALGEYNAGASVPTQTITNRAVSLNSSRVLLAAPGVKTFDLFGNAVTRAPYFTAAMVGGMLAAVPGGTPLTHKYLSGITGLEVNFSPSDLDALLLGGVSPIQFVTNKGPRIVQSKTTWLGAPNFALNEISTQRAIDIVVRRVQDTLDDQLVGQKLAPETLAQAASITETILKQAIIDGFIVGDKNSPAYASISASAAGGDVIRVQFQISPAIPANYVNVTVSTVPYSGQVVINSRG
jgi:hypothetical protein